LLRAVPERTDKHGHPRPIDLRDKALLALLSLQVLRTVEIWRSNVEDVQRRDDQWALLVRGEGHDRLIYLRSDVGEAVQRPGRRRLSRRGVRTIVDGHLRKLDLKRPSTRPIPMA